MTKMKKSEFRAIVKECVRECLREVLREQLVPLPMMQEMVAPRLLAAQTPQQQGPINPYDGKQMLMRQEILAQRGALNQLQRQSQSQSMMQQPLAPLAEIAGLGVTEEGPTRYQTQDTGYVSPLDRLRQVDPTPRNGYDPALDGPARPQRMQAVARQPMLDPSLDTPIGGGDMRPPDPEVMRGILEHTMQTTYLAQAAIGHTGPGHAQPDGGSAYAPPATKEAAIVAQHNPEELFTGAQNWALLAFK